MIEEELKKINLFTKKEVLVFLRRNGKMQFNLFYEELFKKFQIENYRTISEYKNGDFYINLDTYYDKILEAEEFDLFYQLFDINQTIARCRVLRELGLMEAKKMIFSCAAFFIDFYKSHPEVKVLFTSMVDSYVMEIMVKLGKSFGIEVHGVVGFAVFGYKRITIYGELNNVRDVADNEVDEVLKKLSGNYKVIGKPNISRALANSLKDYFSWHIRYFYFHIYKRKIVGKKNYDYFNVSYFRPFNSVLKLRAHHFFQDIPEKAIINEPQNFILYPLHFHPEATVDYWAEDAKQADYLQELCEMFSFLSNRGYKVLVKEHPAMYLKRSIDFYSKINSLENVIIINPFIDSSRIFTLVDKIVVHTGTMGLEAILQDKKVFIATENYYSFNLLPHFKDIDVKFYPFWNLATKRDVIKKILKGTLKV